jgi:hypothetical protein
MFHSFLTEKFLSAPKSATLRSSAFSVSRSVNFPDFATITDKIQTAENSRSKISFFQVGVASACSFLLRLAPVSSRVNFYASFGTLKLPLQIWK